MKFVNAAEWRAGKRERGRRGAEYVAARCFGGLNAMGAEKRAFRDDQRVVSGDLYLRHIRFQWMESARRHIFLKDYKQARRVLAMCRDTRIRSGDSVFWQPGGDVNTNYLNEDRYKDMLAAGATFYVVDVNALDPRDHNIIYREFTRNNTLGGLWGFYDEFVGQHDDVFCSLFFQRQADLMAFNLRFPEYAFLPTRMVDKS